MSSRLRRVPQSIRRTARPVLRRRPSGKIFTCYFTTPRGLTLSEFTAPPAVSLRASARQKENYIVATSTESIRAPLDALGIPLQGWSCGQPQAKVQAGSSRGRWNVGLFAPAKGPFDDATNKSVIKLLPRKPPAIKERPGDRRREFGYIEIRAQLASGALTGDSMVWWDGLPECAGLLTCAYEINDAGSYHGTCRPFSGLGGPCEPGNPGTCIQGL